MTGNHGPIYVRVRLTVRETAVECQTTPVVCQTKPYEHLLEEIRVRVDDPVGIVLSETYWPIGGRNLAKIGVVVEIVNEQDDVWPIDGHLFEKTDVMKRVTIWPRGV